MEMDYHVSDVGKFMVSFASEIDCFKVNQLMNQGMKFQQAVDYLELRPNTHYSVVKLS